MTTHAERAHALLTDQIGRSEGSGDWFTVSQDVIDAFADVAHDHQFIHTDPAAAAEASPWGTTIAHGFLTLSLLTHLSSSIATPSDRLEGITMGINYGFDKVRFVAPVLVDAAIRATSVVAAADLKDPTTIQLTRTMTVEIEGSERPALVADWITRLVYS